MDTGFRVLLSKNKEDLDTTFKNYYSSWRLTNKESSEPFFPVYKTFKDSHLADLDAGALRLYIYMGFSSNNSNGDSWHSIQTIADFFNVQPRTVNGWVKDLVGRGLIRRAKSGHMTNTTYLLPYSTTFRIIEPFNTFKDDSQDLIDHLISNVVEAKEVFGDIVGVYHLFQWGVLKGKPTHTKHIQCILIITKNSHQVITGHYYRLRKSETYGVGNLHIDECFKFDSPFIYNNNRIIGLALEHTPILNEYKSMAGLKSLVNDLSTTTYSDFINYPDIKYGELSTVLPLDDINNSSEEESSADSS